jgi:hypothetical protein
MTISITHPFVSQKSDGNDPTQVQPSNWNAAHTLQMSSGFVVGRMSAYNGAAEELPATTFGVSLLNQGTSAAARVTLGAVNIAGDTMTGALNLPSNGLNVGSGQLQVTGGNVTGSGSLTMAGNITAYSDARLKENITQLSNALKMVKELRGVRYTRRATGHVHIGVIAQEVGGVVPEVIETDGQGIYSVAYGNLVALLIEAVKELSERVEAIERREAI